MCVRSEDQLRPIYLSLALAEGAKRAYMRCLDLSFIDFTSLRVTEELAYDLEDLLWPAGRLIRRHFDEWRYEEKGRVREHLIKEYPYTDVADELLDDLVPDEDVDTMIAGAILELLIQWWGVDPRQISHELRLCNKRAAHRCTRNRVATRQVSMSQPTFHEVSLAS